MAGINNDKTAPSAGGPSTTWGILYQALWCLLRTLRLRVTSFSLGTDGQLAGAVLLLEPRAGGDLQELGTALRRVVQLKTRGGGRTWPLRDIVVDVLPDL